MSLVELPPSLYKSLKNVDYSAAEQIQNKLYHEYNIEVGTMEHFTSHSFDILLKGEGVEGVVCWIRMIGIRTRNVI